MKPIDRLIFAAIAVSLMLLALQPYLAQRHMLGLAEGATVAPKHPPTGIDTDGRGLIQQ